uniref:Secreted protein n=1 Tax=Trichogramma kaykai TaxID=54128 RepID=A0ABD2X2Y2_9HYME
MRASVSFSALPERLVVFVPLIAAFRSSGSGYGGGGSGGGGGGGGATAIRASSDSLCQCNLNGDIGQIVDPIATI